jgi:transglutaminase-like putative cysteine protease
LSAAAAALLFGNAAAAAPTPSHWNVTVAVRIAGGTGAPVSIRLALPADTPAQRIADVAVTGRGLETTVVTEGPEPYVLFRGPLKGARRVAVSYSVDRARGLAAVPAVQPVTAPAPELLPYLAPTPIFQSRSILVRDFLQTSVSPLLGRASNLDLMRAIFQATREQLTWDSRGKSLTLDVLRSGKGNRIGIERVFTTLLRAARIPARLVEGVNLNSATRRKRVFWTEVWAQDRWWPVSASRGWIGREPKSYLALTRDGQKILTVDGGVEATYDVQAVPGEDKT